MKALTKYIEKRAKAINFLLKKSAQEYIPATFHKLHVEIKKVNAFFELLKYGSKDFKRKKTYKPFKQIFIHAGKVRELQVEQAMLKTYFRNNLLKEYKISLNKFYLKEQKDFFLILNKTVIEEIKKSYHEINPFLKSVNKKRVMSYMEKNRKKIKKLLRKETLKTSQIHTLRKRLKKFNYNCKSLSLEKQNKTLPPEVVLPELLGKWHDGKVLIRHLKKAIDSASINSQEVSQLKKIQTKIAFNSQILLNKINATKWAQES